MGEKRAVPTDPKLYEKVKKEAMKRFKSWPSAYGSGWLVSEYKRRGGTYKGSKPRKTSGIARWFELEKWINVCHLPKIVPCGRPTVSKSQYWKKFPYCRPLYRATSKTPRTAKELSKAELKRRCSMKRRTPKKILTPKRAKKISKSVKRRVSKTPKKVKKISKSVKRRVSKSRRR
jgi:hypothetical protein